MKGKKPAARKARRSAPARRRAARPAAAAAGPDLLLDRCPLITEEGKGMLRRLKEHPHAPRFNYETGDRLREEDLPAIERFRRDLLERRGPRQPGPPPAALLGWVAGLRERVPFFRASAGHRVDLHERWEEVPTTSRADLARAPWELVPDDQPLDRLVIYRTAGTTGHPIVVPHHPLAIRSYEPLLELALRRHGARPEFDGRSVACFLVGAQVRTYTYAAVLSNWGGAGFAKLNLRPTEWRAEESPRRYFSELEPRFLTGDPISFAEMMARDLPARPLALVTTSVAMSPELKRRFAARYRAPVIDWYSLVETGPLGYACPLGHGYHLLPHDVHAETIGPDGRWVKPGERGEIAVTGGRNVFLPLVRYRTGDFGRLDHGACPCGDPMPRLLDLEGRVPVLFRSRDGTPVSTVDLSRLLREFPLLLHEFVQRADRSCELVARPLPGARPEPGEIRAALARVLGELPVEVRFDPRLGDRAEGKAQPYRSELLLED